MEAFPGQGLPGTDLGQLKRRAKDWLRRARSNDAEALVLLRRLHPRGAELAAHPDILTLADAQLCLARFHGFPSWPTLREHLQAVEPWKRRPTGSEAGLDDPDAFLRLACLSYSDDDRARVTRAIDLLARDPELSTATIFAAAATGAVEALHALLAADPGAAVRDGGPHRWPPLLYLCFGRVPDDPPARSTLESARLLLAAGAEVNAGFLWQGLAPPFTALTGAFGGGENRLNQPPHQHSPELARLLLEAGADPNDGQALYNRMFEPADDHLRLLFEFGLGSGDGGPWRRRLGAAQQTPKVMLEDQLLWAVSAGRTGRVQLLLQHGVDPDGRGSGHPTQSDRLIPRQRAAVPST